MTGLALRRLGDRLVARGGGHRERNDLHGGDHLAFHHRLEGRQRRQRHRLVDAVEPVDGVLVEHQHAGAIREQIAAAGEGAVGAHALAFHGRSNIGGRLILRDVARLEPRDHDFLDSGCLERGHFRRPDQRALLEHEIALADRMHRGGAERIVRSDRAEFHAASAFSAFMPQPRGDFGHDGDGDLGRRHRADGEPDRRVDARDIGIAQSGLLQPLHAFGMRLPRAERADIETIARQRMLERRIVDLRIVGERDEGRVAIDVERRQRHVRPFRDHLDVGETLDRGKGGARIDDGHVIAEQLPDRRQRLADMHRAGDHQLRRRHVHGEEDAALRRFLHAAFRHADMIFDEIAQRILGDIRRPDQPLLAARHIGDDHRRAPRGAFGIERVQDVEFQLTFST